MFVEKTSNLTHPLPLLFGWLWCQFLQQGLVQLTVATAASPPSSTLLPLPMAFILAMMSVNVSFTVFSRIQPSLSLSGSSGLARLERELLTYCMPTVTATCEGQEHTSDTHSDNLSLNSYHTTRKQKKKSAELT